MAAASFGASSFLEQAASVHTALQATTVKQYPGDLFADAANMASPFLYALTLRWAGGFAGYFRPKFRT
jgi:hypothetical protein